ncbi:MAG: PQQ-like beta-propeller repeat protein [Acidobacteria bacterium]|nr:PQQ-like beta-propeller repeat protein [Acidobacteriota bacterium]
MRLLAALLACSCYAADANWPAFRGHKADGLGASAVPVTWNADPSHGPLQNVLWKTPIPGLSHSSAIVWGGKLFVTTAVSSKGSAPLKVGLYGSGASADDSDEQSWEIYCLDKRTGRILWQRTAYKGVPKAKRHTKATHANTTAATDGRYLLALFGSEGLYCYDLDGKLIWKKDFGLLDAGPEPDLQWGFASSPVIYKDTVVIQADVKQGAFLTLLSLKTGAQIWRTERAALSSRSWATPAVIEASGRTQIVTNGWPHIAGFDYATGKELWRLKSEGDVPVPTPVSAHGLIYVTNAHGGWAPLYAIRPDATGDISVTADKRTSAGIAWSEPRNGAYMQTPLIDGDLLYSCSDRGVLKVYDARTGERKYEQRLGSGTTGFSASPVAAGGKLYFSSEEGEVYVIRAGPKFEQLAVNRMGEITMGSPAVSEGVLFFHTRGHIVAVGSK